MKIYKGLNTDNNPQACEEGQWIRARNILLNRGFKETKTEEGFTLSTVIGSFPVVGIIELDNGAVVFSYNNTGVGIPYFVIDTVENDVKRTALSTTTLTHSEDNFIEGVYKRNSKGELIIAWCSGINDSSDVVRIMNLDNPPFPSGLDLTYELNDATEIVYTMMFPDFTLPSFLPTAESSGGLLKSGTHFLAFAYELGNDEYSNYIAISPTIKIFDDSIDTTVELMADSISASVSTLPSTYNKVQAGEYCNKAINLYIANIDTRYKYFKLLNIVFSGGAIEVYESDKIIITATSVNYVYKGNFPNASSIDNYTTDRLVFDKCKSITSLWGKLYVGNLREKDIIEYQKYANNIKVEYAVSAIASMQPTTTSLSLLTSFMPDEVYALYIRLVRLDGTRTNWFHIPGREVGIYSDEGGVNVDENELLSNYNAGVYPGAAIPATAEELLVGTTARIFHVRDTSNGALLGYWENEGEYYSQTEEDTETWDVSAGGVGFRLAGTTGGVFNYKRLQEDVGGNPILIRHHKMPSYRYVDPDQDILLNFSDIKFPTEILNEIQSFQIGYAKRNNDNISVIGTSPIMTRDWFDPPARTQACCRWYDFGLLSEAPTLQINPSYIKANYDSLVVPAADLDLTAGAIGRPVVTDVLMKVNSALYFPSNNSATPRNNIFREASYDLETNLVGGANVQNVQDYALGDMPIGQLYYFKPTVYFSYYQQEVINTNSNVPITAGVYSYTANNVRGDVHCTYHMFMAVNLNGIADPPPGPGPYTVNFIKYRVHSPFVSAIRNINPGTVFGDYGYMTTVGPPSIPELPNTYQSDYKQINNLKITTCYNPYFEYLTNFPYWIQRSVTNYWRYFLVGDGKEVPRDKGTIQAITGVNRVLFVHQLSSTYIYSTKDVLETNTGTVYTGEGDIFDRTPQEIKVDKVIDSGMQSQCARMICEQGYIYINNNNGIIFQIKGDSSVELSNDYIRKYLMNNINTVDPAMDNPYFGVGLILGYDFINKRLLVTKRDYVTASYTYLTYNVGGTDYTILTITSAPEYQGEIFLAPLPAPTDALTSTWIYKYNGNYYVAVAGAVAPGYNLSTSLNSAEYNLTVDGGDGYLELLEISSDAPTHLVSDYTFATDNHLTLSYSFDEKCWVCNHDYYPVQYARFAKELYAVDNYMGSSFYKMRGGNPGVYFQRAPSTPIYPAYFDLVIHKNVNINKIWESVTAITKSVLSNIDKPLYTFSHIMLYNDHQCSGLVIFSYQTKDWFNNQYARRINDKWFFNNFRDRVVDVNLRILDDSGNPIASNVITTKDYYDKNVFLSNFIVIRVYHDNIDTRTIYFNDIDMIVREDNR